MENNKEKINICSKKDFNISYYVGPGKGGQNKQKTHSGVLLTHKGSGAQGRCSESRSQAENKIAAFNHLINTPRFKFWLNKKLYEIKQQETMEQTVEKELTPANLKIEIKDKEGKWIDVGIEYFETEEAKKEI